MSTMMWPFSLIFGKKKKRLVHGGAKKERMECTLKEKQAVLQC